MSSPITVSDYFRAVSELISTKFVRPPSALGGFYEVKEQGQASFEINPVNLTHHNAFCFETCNSSKHIFKVPHKYAHRSADRLFIVWDAPRDRIVFFACELKTKHSGGAWTQLQVTLAFARQVDSLVRVNGTLPQRAVFAGLIVKSTPFALKHFSTSSFNVNWTRTASACPLGTHHAHHDRALNPLRLHHAISTLP
jgi:hypothetical protein